MIEITAPLAVIHHSIVIKRSSVREQFWMGEAEFESTFGIERRNQDLYLAICMSGLDVEREVQRLALYGLCPGEDFGLAHMSDGPMLDCPGLVFFIEGGIGCSWWYVNAELKTAHLTTGC